jgi:hypothetical protein
MLLVIPFAEKSLPLYQHLFSLGGVAMHDVLLVGGNRDVAEIEKALNILKGAFANADVFTGDHVYTSRNKLFHDTAHYLDLVGCTDPWYWFDETCCPLRPSWLTEIAKEYFAAKMPYLGATERSVERNPATGKPYEEPPRLIASSIYPPDLYLRSTLIRRLGYGPKETPWNVTMRFEIRKEAATSKLIQNQAGTSNYRGGPDGKYFFKEAPGVNAEPIAPHTAVVAGVSDGSVLEVLNPKPKPAKKKSDESEPLSA